MKHQCEAFTGQSGNTSRCRATGAHEHDGKWYCRLHHPPTKDGRLAARSRAYDAKWSARERIREAEGAVVAAAEAWFLDGDKSVDGGLLYRADRLFRAVRNLLEAREARNA